MGSDSGNLKTDAIGEKLRPGLRCPVPRRINNNQSIALLPIHNGQGSAIDQCSYCVATPRLYLDGIAECISTIMEIRTNLPLLL